MAYGWSHGSHIPNGSEAGSRGAGVRLRNAAPDSGVVPVKVPVVAATSLIQWLPSINLSGERGRNRTYNLVIKSRARKARNTCLALPNNHNIQRLTRLHLVWHYACMPTVSKWYGHKIGHSATRFDRRRSFGFAGTGVMKWQREAKSGVSLSPTARLASSY